MSENTTSKATSEPKVRQPVLRKVDLNLLTIFDTVMQEQKQQSGAHAGHVSAGGQQRGLA
jgi:LysR family transcriptional activator for leuABCD operon